jgi:hypothetical protein
VTANASELELQQYLFDLHGYLVIHDVLTPAEVNELNRLSGWQSGSIYLPHAM